MSAATPDPRALLLSAADAVADQLDADILVINAPIYRPLAMNVIDLCGTRRRRTNLLFILVTSGGDADAAFRLARCFQDSYTRVFGFVSGYCKSAGTLVMLAANELIVGDAGEIGPIDVQMSKPDELMQRQSGLTATAALDSLNDQSFEAFSYFFVEMVRRGQGSISTKTATHLAVQMVSGLYSPLYSHLDPMHVGEAGRALEVARRYGQQLQVKSGNFSERPLEQLITEYPSHGFVIDRAEIERLFNVVKRPTVEQKKLAQLLADAALNPLQNNQILAAFVSTEQPAPVAQPVQQAPIGGNADDASTSARGADAQPGTAGAATGGEPQATPPDHSTESRPTLAAVGGLRHS